MRVWARKLVRGTDVRELTRRAQRRANIVVVLWVCLVGRCEYQELSWSWSWKGVDDVVSPQDRRPKLTVPRYGLAQVALPSAGLELDTTAIEFGMGFLETKYFEL